MTDAPNPYTSRKHWESLCADGDQFTSLMAGGVLDLFAEIDELRAALTEIRDTPRIAQWVCTTACHQSGGPHGFGCRLIDRVGDIVDAVLPPAAPTEEPESDE